MQKGPIGSYFELPKASVSRGAGIPLPPGAQLVQTGRQALAAVADSLAARGHRRIRVPDYLCDSMVEPFTTRGWSVATYPLDPHLEMDPQVAQLDQGEVWLLAPYFGRHLPLQVSKWAATRAAAGAPVVLDQTHCVLAPDPTPATYAIASLRKTLPLADGAYVLGSDPISFGTDVDSGATAIAGSAAAAKARALDQGNYAGVRQAHALFSNAEHLLGKAVLPAAMSESAVQLLDQLDPHSMISTRRSNALALAGELTHVAGIEPLRGISSAAAPAYLTCKVNEGTARAFQRELAAEFIFCPIHWPRPQSISIRTWRSDLISFPVDHRYDVEDMLFVARQAESILQGSPK